MVFCSNFHRIFRVDTFKLIIKNCSVFAHTQPFIVIRKILIWKFHYFILGNQFIAATPLNFNRTTEIENKSDHKKFSENRGKIFATI